MPNFKKPILYSTQADIEKYFRSVCAEEVKQICKPLFDHFGVTNFVYRVNYNDGSEISLTNNPAWSEFFYTNKGLIEESTFDKHPQHYKSGFILWSSLKGHRKILEYARQFNIDHGLTIINKLSDGMELVFLGTTPDKPEVANYCLNNIDLLEKFILYFKNQAHELIESVNKNRIYIPNKFERVKVIEQDIQAVSPLFSRDEFMKAIQLKKYELGGNFKGVVLSQREMDCIRCLLQGMTSEETGKELFLSPRTVEDYLSDIRAKFNVSSKSELMQMLLQDNFAHYVFTP